jgi:glycosyltransferase involved in cell wall biosynthesis
MSPFFSIIIPMYNREAFVGRALRSCLDQDFTDFEAVVVDDGSNDRSIAAVQRFADARIRLERHDRNRGRCPARNTGMAVATGAWFVFLDTDDELLPGALSAIHRRARAAAAEVGSLRFMCEDERGLSPIPAHRDELLDYEGYIRLLDPMLASGRGEALPCSRASTFPAIQYPDDHSPEGLYHLNMARLYCVQSCPDVVRRYHHDAPNQITVPIAQRSLRYAADDAADAARVLAQHGPALQRWAPITYRQVLASGALANFISGRRLAGLRYSAASLALQPLSIKVWARLFAGLLGGRPTARLQSAKSAAFRKLGV